MTRGITGLFWKGCGSASLCADSLDVPERGLWKGISDEKALQVMRKASGAMNLEEFLRLPDKRREGALQRMYKAGASLTR